MQDLTVLLMKMNFPEFHRYIYFLYSTARWQKKNEGKKIKIRNTHMLNTARFMAFV